MLMNYIKDRYGNIFETEGQLYAVLEEYTRALVSKGAKVINEPYGFIIYSLQGDACIVWDIYTAPEYRKKGAAWKLFQGLMKQLEKADKRVIIGFSDKIGQNHGDGIGAMTAAGFIPAFETVEQQVFLRGI